MPVVIVSGLPFEISFPQLLNTLRKIFNKEGSSNFWLKDLSNSPASETKHAKIEFNSGYLALLAKNRLDDFVLDYNGEKYPLFAYSQDDDQAFATNRRGAPSSYRGGMQRGSHHSGSSQQEHRPFFQRGRGQSIPIQARQFNSPAGASRGRGQSRPHYDGPREEPRPHFDHPRGGMQPRRVPSDFPREERDDLRPNYEMQRERSSELDNIKSQSSKLDLELELLRKQRLVIEEERKLLLEKQKLEQVRELGPKDHFYGEAHRHDFGPERNFGGPQMGFRGGMSYSGGRGHQGQGRGYPLPQMRGNPRFKRQGPDFLARYPQDHKTQRFEYNHTHPSQPYLKSYNKNTKPLFHTACKILIEQMKPLLSECSPNTEIRKVTEQIRIILRSRIAVALEKVQTEMTGSDKAKLYRKLYSESTDKAMIDKILRQMRERQADSEIKGKEEKCDEPAEAEDDVDNGIGDETSETMDPNSTLTSVDETMNVDSTVEDKASKFTLEEAQLEKADENMEVADKNLEEADKALEVADKNLDEEDKALEVADKNLVAKSEVKDKNLEKPDESMEGPNLKKADNNLVEPSSPEQDILRERVTSLELEPAEGRLEESLLEDEGLLLGNGDEAESKAEDAEYA